MPTVKHDDIYKEVRSYLIGLFSYLPETVVKGYQNGSSLPDNAIVMTILYERDLDVSANYYESMTDSTTVQQSVEVTMQIDFYGVGSGDKARKLTTLWRNIYTTQILKCCQPLYAKSPRQMTYVNEKDQYEQRWSMDLLMQYNPYFEHEQNYINTIPDILTSQP